MDTTSVELVRKSGTGYSATQFDIGQNTSSDGRLVTVPENVILEIKNLDSDLVGVIR